MPAQTAQPVQDFQPQLPPPKVLDYAGISDAPRVGLCGRPALGLADIPYRPHAGAPGPALDLAAMSRGEDSQQQTLRKELSTVDTDQPDEPVEEVPQRNAFASAGSGRLSGYEPVLRSDGQLDLDVFMLELDRAAEWLLAGLAVDLIDDLELLVRHEVANDENEVATQEHRILRPRCEANRWFLHLGCVCHRSTPEPPIPFGLRRSL